MLLFSTHQTGTSATCSTPSCRWSTACCTPSAPDQSTPPSQSPWRGSSPSYSPSGESVRAEVVDLKHKSTVLVLRMAHRKWKEFKQQPSMFPGSAVPGSCLVSFYFLWAILSTSTVHVRTVLSLKLNTRLHELPRPAARESHVAGSRNLVLTF